MDYIDVSPASGDFGPTIVTGATMRGPWKEIRVAVLAGALAGTAMAQTDASVIEAVLGERLISQEVVGYQLSRYLIERVPEAPSPANAAEWTKRSAGIREKILETILRGWPADWIDSPLAFEEAGFVEGTRPGYRIRKLRLEVIPGLHVPALLYEPEGAAFPAPAILNVNGHIYGRGKEIDYKQQRCIDQAKQGIYSLNLEWLYFGELDHPENQHWFGAHLDLVGANGIGLFYIAAKRGIDYLHAHPAIDKDRIGMTGLSGGGWQTVLLTALDERVRAAVPVAGHSSLVSRIEDFGPGDIGDWEQKGTDFLSEFEYTHLTSLIAPRPLLQIHNAEDIFRSHRVKPGTYDALAPIWDLYAAGDAFLFHENFDPADHNYEADNQLQASRFFAERFGLPTMPAQVRSDAEHHTAAELQVGLPPQNLTILGLAKLLARRIDHGAIPQEPGERASWAHEQREILRETLRYSPVTVKRAWFLSGTRMHGLDTRSYRFDFNNGLSATGVLLEKIDGTDSRPLSILLHDSGKAAAAGAAAKRVRRGERVLVADLIFSGDATLPGDRPERNVQVLAAIGERPLGIEAAQLIALQQWLGGTARIETEGPRSQVTALAAGALSPASFSQIVDRNGLESLQEILDRPIRHLDAPDLFCFDLLRGFDIDRLTALWRSR